MENFSTAGPDKRNKCLGKRDKPDKSISHIYSVLLNVNASSSEVYKMLGKKKWDQPIKNKLWEWSLKNIHSCSMNATDTIYSVTQIILLQI